MMYRVTPYSDWYFYDILNAIGGYFDRLIRLMNTVPCLYLLYYFLWRSTFSICSSSFDWFPSSSFHLFSVSMVLTFIFFSAWLYGVFLTWQSVPHAGRDAVHVNVVQTVAIRHSSSADFRDMQPVSSWSSRSTASISVVALCHSSPFSTSNGMETSLTLFALLPPIFWAVYRNFVSCALIVCATLRWVPPYDRAGTGVD